jgi:hypothetical protein
VERSESPRTTKLYDRTKERLTQERGGENQAVGRVAAYLRVSIGPTAIDVATRAILSAGLQRVEIATCRSHRCDPESNPRQRALIEGIRPNFQKQLSTGPVDERRMCFFLAGAVTCRPSPRVLLKPPRPLP